MRTLEVCLRQVRPLRGGKFDMVEINWLAALAGTTWQEALNFVRARCR